MITLTTPINITTVDGTVQATNAIIDRWDGLLEPASSPLHRIVWRLLDALGNTIDRVVVDEMNASDLTVFATTPGGFRVRAYAALQNHRPALAGTVT